MDTARNGAGRLVGHANIQGPWLAPRQRSLAGPGIRELFWIRYSMSYYSTSIGRRAVEERFIRVTRSEHRNIVSFQPSGHLFMATWKRHDAVRSSTRFKILRQFPIRFDCLFSDFDPIAFSDVNLANKSKQSSYLCRKIRCIVRLDIRANAETNSYCCYYYGEP